jgi:hypothetical protein
MASKDPLQLLREFISGDKEIKQKDETLIFGSKQFALSTPTNWKPKGSEKAYKLGDLWLFLKHKVGKTEAPRNEYFTEVKKFKAQLVSIPHQGRLISV